MNRTVRRTVIVLVVLAVGYFALAWVWHEMNVWPQRRALPESASDIHEWFWEDGFLPDYSYVLKARISADEFRSYVQGRGLMPHTATRKYEDDDGWLSWKSHCHEAWWNPSDSLEGTFVSNHGDQWTYAKYEDGYIYVKSLNH